MAEKAPKISTKKDTSAPVKLKDYQLKSLLNESNNIQEEGKESSRIMTNEEEFKALKAETIAAFHSAVPDENVGEENDDDDELLTLRTKSQKEKDSEDKDYKKFLDEVVGGEGLERALQLYDNESKPSGSKKKKNKQHQEDEQFLRE